MTTARTLRGSSVRRGGAGGWLAGVALLGAAACGAADPVPENPTWVDVQPILQGRCFGCHGAVEQARRPYGAGRWDVYDRDDYGGLAAGTDIGSDFHGSTMVGQTDVDWLRRVSVYDFLTPASLKSPMRMPPPPADPLSARELEILRGWFSADPAEDRSVVLPKGARDANAEPVARLLPDRNADGKVVIVLEDADGDQVLGRLEGSTPPVMLPYAGAHAVDVAAGAAVNVTISDGWIAAPKTVNLGAAP